MTRVCVGFLLAVSSVLLHSSLLVGQSRPDTLPAERVLEGIDPNARRMLVSSIGARLESLRSEEKFRELLEGAPKVRERYFEYLVTCSELAFAGTGEAQGLDAWGAGMVVLATPRDLLLDAIVPELDLGRRLEDVLESERNELIAYLELHSAEDGVFSFHFYRGYLRQHPEVVPQGLVRHMMARSPQSAMHILLQTRGADLVDPGEVGWAVHKVGNVVWKLDNGYVELGACVPEAAKQLDKLSRQRQWWVRLYVAGTLRRHPTLRTSEIINRLKEDEHILVRRTIATVGR